MSQVSIVDIEHNNPQIPTRFNANVGFAIPIANVLEIYGDTVPAGVVPVYTTGSGNNITTNVQLSQAIAASDATRVGLAAFDSASFGVDANGFVTFTGSTFDGLTPDDGGQVTPVANNINVFGQKALVAPVMTTHNIAGDFYIENRAWETQYVVDASTTVGIQGTYSTIQTAINQAVADGASLTVEKMIYVRYGTYIENLTIPPGIFLKGDAMVEQPGPIPLFTEIRGNHTFGDTNVFRCENIYFTNIDSTLDMFSPATIIIVNAVDCVFNNGSSTGYIFTLDFNFQHFTNCIFYGNTYQPVLNLINAGSTVLENCSFPTSSAINNTQLIRFLECSIVGPVICSGGQILARNSMFNGDTNCITGNGSSVAFWYCTFTSSSDCIDYTGEVCLSGCSLSPGNVQNMYAAGQLLNCTPTLAGQIHMHQEVATNTIATDQYVIYVDASGGPITITLPYEITIDKTYVIKDWKGQAASNNITVEVSTPGGTIEGSATFVLNQNYQVVCLQMTGTPGEWIILWNSTSVLPSSSKEIFSAYLSSTQSNVTGDGTVYTVLFDTVVVDTASSYNSGTGVFTAPYTGNYLFNASINLDGLDIAHVEGIFSFSGSVYESRFARYNMGAMATAGTFQQSGSMQIPMTAGDTMTVFAFVNSGTKTVDVVGAAAPTIYTNFSAYYLG